MRKLIMLAGALAVVTASPALAKGNGKGGKAEHSAKAHGKAASGRADDGRHTVRDRDGRLVRVRHDDLHHANCPPGLAKKNNGCLPPGQAKKRFAEGQRLPTSYRYLAVPDRYRSQINYNRYDADDRFFYDDGQVYVVDRRTRLIEDIIRLVL